MRRSRPARLRVTPMSSQLHGELPVEQQSRVLQADPDGHRRIVLATNVAESSVTLPGVRVVIDSGLAREPRYDPNSGFARLDVVTIAQASADQRAGRAGRVAEGFAYRLWPESQRLEPQRRAEIAQVELAAPRAGTGGLGRCQSALRRCTAARRARRCARAAAPARRARRRRDHAARPAHARAGHASAPGRDAAGADRRQRTRTGLRPRRADRSARPACARVRTRWSNAGRRWRHSAPAASRRTRRGALAAHRPGRPKQWRRRLRVDARTARRRAGASSSATCCCTPSRPHRAPASQRSVPLPARQRPHARGCSTTARSTANPGSSSANCASTPRTPCYCAAHRWTKRACNAISRERFVERGPRASGTPARAASPP